MPERKYRTALFENYVSTLAPEQSDGNTPTFTVQCASGLCRLKKWLPPGQSIKCLDLGCGSGYAMRALRSAGYSDVLGIDVSSQAADLARKAGFKVTEAELREYLLECNECYDLITAFDVIEHFDKNEVLEVLQLIWKRLKVGGTLILQTPNALSPWVNSLRYGDLTHEVIYSSKCLASLLVLTGFSNVETREVAPCAHGLKGLIRWPLWKAVWLGYAVWNVAETGSLLGGVYSRNMLVRATKTQV